MLPLYGVGVKGYRSYGEEFQYFGPLGKLNLLAGQNNAGKSNVIRLIVDHLKDLPGWVPAGLDRPRGLVGSNEFGFALGLPPAARIVEAMPGIENVDVQSRSALEKMLSQAMTPPGAEGSWIRFGQNQEGTRAYLRDDVVRLDEFDRNNTSSLERIRLGLTSTGGGGRYDDEVAVLDYVVRVLTKPNISLIQSFRQIGPILNGPNGANDKLAGTNLIQAIAALQNPDAIDQDDAEAKYSALNEFVSSVFDQRGVKLEVPASRATFNVRTKNVSLFPLEHQGTGIHQVIIIAAFATTNQNQLICIEEPEVNLHPILQRRLLKYLYEMTNNQYVIATHSAQMLDYERGNVFHLTVSESGTKISPAATPALLARICSDLGYKASDLLQCNAVVWVEGPSDRTYVNHWLKQVAPELEEGIHYSIMFYGGGLLRELSADDPVVSEFINLHRLNRNVAIVIDSDRKSAGRPINKTKMRVRNEIQASVENGYVWVTDGYTIENYVPNAVLVEAVKGVHPRKASDSTGVDSKFTNPLGGIESPDKPKIAKSVVAQWPDSLSDRSLRKHVTELADFIRRSNIGMLPEVSSTLEK